eukprot:GILK01007379.1.p1 GENE.GILK01007379.1~~GILK01007379.1.p1  ORF type:complete len:124 (+),score=24.25 GILK01007379.1:31-372(+)
MEEADEALQSMEIPVPTDASAVFCNEFQSLANEDSVARMVSSQREILAALVSAREGMTNFNEHATHKFGAMSASLLHYTKLMKEMKEDLDYVFKKIRVVSTRLQQAVNTQDSS